MAIRVSLDRVLRKRGLTLTDAADRVGLTLANLSILKTGKARAVRFSTLDALCRELDCQPGDLLAFEPGPAEVDDEEPEMLELRPAPRRRGRPPQLKQADTEGG